MSEPLVARGPVVCGETAADRLMRSLDYRLSPDVPSLTRDQVSVVLHALADHTALEAAAHYAQPTDGYWPVTTSIGRWLHATADQLSQWDAQAGRSEGESR